MSEMVCRRPRGEPFGVEDEKRAAVVVPRCRVDGWSQARLVLEPAGDLERSGKLAFPRGRVPGTDRSSEVR